MLIAFTGAGISQPSGIPTFAEQGDLRSKLDRYFSREHPEEFAEVINTMKETCAAAEPNLAHKILAERDVPVITMNIDNLHRRAGTKEDRLLEIHGNLFKDNVVLYGDTASEYQTAFDWIDRMNEDDILLIVGTSFYTGISTDIYSMAKMHNATVVVLNDDAEFEVPLFVESHPVGDFEEFMAREPKMADSWLPYNY